MWKHISTVKVYRLQGGRETEERETKSGKRLNCEVDNEEEERGIASVSRGKSRK